MVFFNYATMQMAAKIVYYGPGLCGKTTNLHVIYGRTAPTARGEMVSLETETDRTLFFDLLPIDVGVIGGFKTRLQLYTVPGQVFYNTTRKLVLKGVDGVVFVADSQAPMLEPNKESFRNLGENLAEIGLSLEQVPLVLQYNKRDLSNVLPVEELNAALNPDLRWEWHEASARNGTGVFETLKGISKLTLKALKGRMTADLRRPSVFAAPATPAPTPRSTPPLAAASPAAIASADEALAASPEAAARLADLAAAVARRERPRDSGAFSRTPPPDAAAPPAPSAPGAESAPRPARAADEAGQDISFGETREPAPPPQPDALEGSVKHVKVRSNVDILAELDKLRKLSTQKPAGAAPQSGSFRTDAPGRSKTSPGMSIDDLLASGLNHRKDVARSFDVPVPRDVLGRSRQVKVELHFTDDEGKSLSAESSFVIDLSAARDLRKLLLSLKFNVEAD